MGIQARYCGRKREDCKRAKGLQRRIRSQKYGWSRARTYGQAGAKNCREAASYFLADPKNLPLRDEILSDIISLRRFRPYPSGIRFLFSKTREISNRHPSARKTAHTTPRPSPWWIRTSDTQRKTWKRLCPNSPELAAIPRRLKPQVNLPSGLAPQGKQQEPHGRVKK